MKDKKEMLLEYIRANVAPILVDFIFGKDLPNATVLSADIDISELNGHYEGTEFMPPKWFNDLINKENKLLIIDKIDTIDKDEQLKFGELLKYRKIATFELPENCVILVTANKISDETINEEIFSLVARM